MKKLLMTMTMMFMYLFGFSQIDSIKLTKNGVNSVTIKTNFPKNIVYNRTINWINETYNNPEKVIVGKSDDMITIHGIHEDIFSMDNLLDYSYFKNIEYHIYFTINNESVNFNIVIDQFYSDSFKNSVNEMYFKLLNLGDNIKEKNKVKADIAKFRFEKFLNLLLFNYNDFLLKNDLSSEEAIDLLKKYKNKLDLELISQEEYNKQKIELLKYIK